MKRKLFFSFLLTVGGCSNYYPLPVAKPSQYDVEKQLQLNKCAKDSNQCASSNNTNSDRQDLVKQKIMPEIPQTYTNMLSFALAYRDVWHEKYLKLVSQTYVTSEIGFLGTLTALIAGVNGATTTAWVGGGVAAGTVLVPERYQYSVQIYNYKSAAETAQCIYSALELLDVKAVEYMSDTNFAREIGQYEYRKMQDVTYALENKQAAVSLMTPDLTAFQQMIGKGKNTTTEPHLQGTKSPVELYKENMQESKQKIIDAINLCTAAVSGK